MIHGGKRGKEETKAEGELGKLLGRKQLERVLVCVRALFVNGVVCGFVGGLVVSLGRRVFWEVAVLLALADVHREVEPFV